MCTDEMIVFFVFLCCVVVKWSSFWRNALPPSLGWVDWFMWMLNCMTKYILTKGILKHVHTYWRTVQNVCHGTKPLAQGIPRTVNRNSASSIQNSPLLRNFRGHSNHHTNLHEVFSGIFVVFFLDALKLIPKSSLLLSFRYTSYTTLFKYSACCLKVQWHLFLVYTF
jgi:hypothetical protein